MELTNQIINPTDPEANVPVETEEYAGTMELDERVDMNALRIVRDNFEEVYKRMKNGFWEFNSKTKEYDPVDYTTAFTIINEYYLKKLKTTTIKYKYSARSNSGRRFADGTSLQGLCKQIRHTIAGSMTDIDMKNAHPTFVAQLCKDFEHPVLQKYITDRDNCLQSWIGTNVGKTFDKMTKKWVENTILKTKDEVKEYFLKVLNGGGNYKTSNTELNEFYTTHNIFLEAFYHDKQYAKYRKIADNNHARNKPTRDNRKGSTLNHYLCYVEDKVLKKIEQYLQGKNIEYGALCFDGLMLYPTQNISVLLEELNKMLLKEMGFSIIMAEKKMTEAINISDLKVKDDIDSSDEGLAKYFINSQRPNMKYSIKRKQLYMYDDTTALWKVRDFDYLRTLFTKVLIPYINTNPNPREITDTIRDLKEDKKLRALLQTITPWIKAFDDDDFILNTFDNIMGLIPLKDCKIIDLQTGEVRNRIKEDYMTKATNSSIVDYTEDDIDFVKKYFGSLLKTDDNNYIECLMSDIAYSFTGENNQKVLFILLGGKDGGKSLFLELIMMMMNGFSTPINKRILIQQKNQSCHDSEMFGLIGNRIGTVSEFSDKDRWDEPRMKAMTGRDAINIRGAGQHSTVNVLLSIVMWVATNKKPKYTDEAFASRLRYYDFCNSFERNDAYANDIKSKSDIIFSIICSYAKKFYENGKKLMVCEKIQQFTEKQNKESNPLKHWIDKECFQPGTYNEWIAKPPLYDEYKNACVSNQWNYLGLSDFYKEFESILKVKEVKIKYKENDTVIQTRVYRELKREKEPGEEYLEDDVKE